MRQEIAALKEAVEQNNVEELRQEIASLEDTVRTRRLEVVNSEGIVVLKAYTFQGYGRLTLLNEIGQPMMTATHDKYGGLFVLLNKSLTGILQARTTMEGNGSLLIKDKIGQDLIYAGASKSGTGGHVAVDNKTGETVITLSVDDYGNGEIGAWNRKGKGRIYDSK